MHSYKRKLNVKNVLLLSTSILAFVFITITFCLVNEMDKMQKEYDKQLNDQQVEIIKLSNKLFEISNVAESAEVEETQESE